MKLENVTVRCHTFGGVVDDVRGDLNLRVRGQCCHDGRVYLICAREIAFADQWDMIATRQGHLAVKPPILTRFNTHIYYEHILLHSCDRVIYDNLIQI